jgi:hypothetical protein
MKSMIQNSILILIIFLFTFSFSLQSIHTNKIKLDKITSNKIYEQNDIYMNELENTLEKDSELNNQIDNFLETKQSSNQNNKSEFSSKKDNKYDIKKENPKISQKFPLKNKLDSVKKSSPQFLKSEKDGKFPKVITYTNTKLISEDVKKVSYQKCLKKSGYIKIVKNKKMLPKELYLLPIFIYLSPKSLNLYISNDSGTLFKSIKLVKIERISQQRILKSNNCFDIIESDFEEGQVILKSGLTLCSELKSEMEAWVKAILEFKECQIRISDNSNKFKEEIFSNLNKTSDLLHSKSLPKEQISTEERIKELYYNSADKAIRKAPRNLIQERIVTKTVQKISEDLTRSNIEKNFVQRTMKDNLSRARKFTEEMEKKQEELEEVMNRKLQHERITETQLITVKHQTKEKELLEAVEKRIINIKREEVDKYKKVYNKEIEEEKERANDKGKKFMRIILEENKLTSYDECTDNRLLNFQDNSYAIETCRRYYGLAVRLIFIYLFIHLL